MLTSNSDRGVSPIIGILIMVAITLVLAGVAALWFFGFQSDTSDDGKAYLFKTDLDGSDDTILITLMNGDPFNSTMMRVKLDGNDVDVPYHNFTAGDTLVVDAGIDVIPGENYEIKIIMNNKQMYVGHPVANP